MEVEEEEEEEEEEDARDGGRGDASAVRDGPIVCLFSELVALPRRRAAASALPSMSSSGMTLDGKSGGEVGECGDSTWPKRRPMEWRMALSTSSCMSGEPLMMF